MSGFPQWVKNLPAMQEMKADVHLIPWLGQSYGGGLGNPLQCSCLENPMDRGAWWATVHEVAKNQTRLKELSSHAYMHMLCQTIFQALGFDPLWV